MSDIFKRLRNPPFGTETSERNLFTEAADSIEGLLEALKTLVSDAADTIDGAYAGHPMRRSIAVARNAIAKATGAANG